MENLLPFYLGLAWEKFRAKTDEFAPGSVSPVKEVAVQWIRPKMTAVCAILFGLLPIMWSPGLPGVGIALLGSAGTSP
jgi:hypothetical protein